MSEILEEKPTTYTRPDWFVPRDGFTHAGLHIDFDNRSKEGNLDELHRIANLLEISHARSPYDQDVLTTRYKCLSIPRYEQLFALQQGYEPGEQLGNRLDDVYVSSVELLRVTLEAQEAFADDAQFQGELTGAASEQTVGSLINRNGQFANFIAIPATKFENEGEITPNARRNGFDFAVYAKDNANTFVKTQVKTNPIHNNEYQLDYEPDILIIVVRELARFGNLAVPIRDLQNALIHEVDGIATDYEKRIIGRASMILTEKIVTHLNTLWQQK